MAQPRGLVTWCLREGVARDYLRLGTNGSDPVSLQDVGRILQHSRNFLKSDGSTFRDNLNSERIQESARKSRQKKEQYVKQLERQNEERLAEFEAVKAEVVH